MRGGGGGPFFGLKGGIGGVGKKSWGGGRVPDFDKLRLNLPQIHQIKANIDHLRAPMGLGKLRPGLARIGQPRPEMVKFGQKSTSFGQIPAKYSTTSTGFVHKLARKELNLSQLRSDLARW